LTECKRFLSAKAAFTFDLRLADVSSNDWWWLDKSSEVVQRRSVASELKELL
jgi:hypothetical protein